MDCKNYECRINKEYYLMSDGRNNNSIYNVRAIDNEFKKKYNIFENNNYKSILQNYNNNNINNININIIKNFKL